MEEGPPWPPPSPSLSQTIKWAYKQNYQSVRDRQSDRQKRQTNDWRKEKESNDYRKPVRVQAATNPIIFLYLCGSSRSSPSSKRALSLQQHLCPKLQTTTSKAKADHPRNENQDPDLSPSWSSPYSSSSFPALFFPQSGGHFTFST